MRNYGKKTIKKSCFNLTPNEKFLLVSFLSIYLEKEIKKWVNWVKDGTKKQNVLTNKNAILMDFTNDKFSR